MVFVVRELPIPTPFPQPTSVRPEQHLLCPVPVPGLGLVPEYMEEQLRPVPPTNQLTVFAALPIQPTSTPFPQPISVPPDQPLRFREPVLGLGLVSGNTAEPPPVVPPTKRLTVFAVRLMEPVHIPFPQPISVPPEQKQQYPVPVPGVGAVPDKIPAQPLLVPPTNQLTGFAALPMAHILALPPPPISVQ